MSLNIRSQYLRGQASSSSSSYQSRSTLILATFVFSLRVVSATLSEQKFPINNNNNNIDNLRSADPLSEETITITSKLSVLERITKQSSLNLFVVSVVTTLSLIAISNHLLRDNQEAAGSEEGAGEYKRSRIRDRLSNFKTTIMDGISYGRSRLANSGFSQPGANARDPEYRRSYNVAMKTGVIGGLVNDGNTCFMNSVLQSLASSNEFTEFLEAYTTAQKDPSVVDSDDPLKFSKALRLLISKINGKHFNRSGYYKTKPLMKALPHGPNKNLILGYDQEDAQEFYQMVLKELEKEYVKTLPGYTEEKKKRESSPSDSFTDRTEDMIFGLDKLGELGEVYVPATQIDPNFPNPENKVYKMNLITPVDGLSAERIGCTQCGEIGGIRYSVISGLSLNLQATNKSSYSLEELLNDWIQPEIIDDVECNRCGLMQMCKIVEAQITNSGNERISTMMAQRLEEIKAELSKPIISDEAYKRLHTKNHIQKSQKIKQIFYSRPPALLTLHINRSVFDPRTYTIRKNGAQVNFPLKLDLSPYVAACDDINMDARLCFRKQDELLKQEQELREEDTEENEELEKIISSLSVEEDDSVQDPESRPRTDALGNDIIYSGEESEPSESESDLDPDNDNYIPPNTNYESHGLQTRVVEQQPSPPQSVESEKIIETPAGPLTYSLKSIISHFGTHNYGHYIAYRKQRGIWWRVSDETVRIITEREVLSTTGVFMLFYELSSRNDAKDVMPEVEDEEEEVQEEEESDDKDSEVEIDAEEVDSSSDGDYKGLSEGSTDSEADEEDSDKEGSPGLRRDSVSDEEMVKTSDEEYVHDGSN